MKQTNNLPDAYIKDAIQNPLLFQQNNPLISESMSLLNSRMKKSFDSELQQLTSKQLSKGSVRRAKYMKESEQSRHNDETYDMREQDEDELDNSRAIKEFERQIEEKFKISVANKLYTFPRLKITSIMDIISSSESEDDQEPTSQPSSSQQPSKDYNPFDPVHYQQRMKTEYLGPEEIEEESNDDEADRNFKKVKLQNVKVSDGGKKGKDRKNQSLKKQDQANYSHRQKAKSTYKHLEGHQKQKPKSKPGTKGQKSSLTNYPTLGQKTNQAWAVKQPRQKHNVQRLKTEMCNDSSRQSELISESKRKFYEEEFFIRK